MADEDIDDLLDEVETKFCTRNKFQDDKKKPTHSTSKHKSRSKVDDEIDQILQDVDELPDHIPVQPLSSKTPVGNGLTVTNNSRPDSARKCLPLYLSGSSVLMGLGSSFNKRACDKLRCTSCDFKVSVFENFEWQSSTDYLFLRNNAPDFHKLKAKLLVKKGYRAYCCQCCWRSVKDIEELKDPKLKWVCGKH